MQPCYAITSCHLGLLPDRKRLTSAQQLHRNDNIFLSKFCNICIWLRELYCGFVLSERGGSILPQMHQDKEETGCVFFAGYCCPCFCPTGWMAITADFLSSTETQPVEGALTLQYPEGRRQELSKLTPLPCSRGECSSSCCPTGPHCALLLISSISSLGRNWPQVDVGPFSHLCYLVHLWSPV